MKLQLIWSNKVRNIGIAFVVAGLLLWSCMWRWVSRKQGIWQPLTTPISLGLAQIRSPEFTINATTAYRLLIEMNRSIPFQRMECLLGLEVWESTTTCRDIAEIDDISWIVWSEGHIVAKGSSRDERGGTYSDTISKILGSFEAEKGKRYRVILDVRQDASTTVLQRLGLILRRRQSTRA